MAYTEDDLQEALRQKYRNQELDLTPDAYNRMLGMDLTKVDVPTYPADLIYGGLRGLESVTQAPVRSAMMARETGGDPLQAALSQMGEEPESAPSMGDVDAAAMARLRARYPESVASAMLKPSDVAGIMSQAELPGVGPALAAGEIKGVIQGGRGIPTAEEFAEMLRRVPQYHGKERTLSDYEKTIESYNKARGALDEALKEKNRILDDFAASPETTAWIRQGIEDRIAAAQGQMDAYGGELNRQINRHESAWSNYSPVDAPSTEPKQQTPPDIDKLWREMQGIPEPKAGTSTIVSDLPKSKPTGNLRELPVARTEPVRNPESNYDIIKDVINNNLPARFGDNQPKGGVVFKKPVTTTKEGTTVIDTYGRGDVHNAQFTLDGSSVAKVKRIQGGWNEPQPFPADPDDIRGKLPAKGKPIVIGAKSDPFMWMDQKYRGTAALLEDLFGYPNVTLNTRSDLIAHDDYMELLKGLDNPTINIHIPKTGNEYLARLAQPGAPSIARRLKAYKKLKDSGFNVQLVPEEFGDPAKFGMRGEKIDYLDDVSWKRFISNYLKQE